MKSALFLVGGFLCVGLLLGACHQRRTYYQGPSIEGFRFGAHAVIAGPSADTLRVSATAENVSDHPVQDEWGTCYRLNRLAVVAQIGTRTWNSKTWEIGQIPVYHDSRGREIQMACGGAVLVGTVPPGGLLRYDMRVPIKAILGDSLPAGSYRITARIAINGRETNQLQAGEVTLGPPPT